MLYIMDKVSIEADAQTWHVGEPMPLFKHRVIYFQADGEELAVIIEAIKKHSAIGHVVIDMPPNNNEPNAMTCEDSEGD